MRYLTEDTYEKTYRLLCESLPAKREPSDDYKMYEKYLTDFKDSQKGMDNGVTYGARYINQKTGKTRESTLPQSELKRRFDQFNMNPHGAFSDRGLTGIHTFKYEELPDEDLAAANSSKSTRVYDQDMTRDDNSKTDTISILSPSRDSGWEFYRKATKLKKPMSREEFDEYLKTKADPITRQLYYAYVKNNSSH